MTISGNSRIVRAARLSSVLLTSACLVAVSGCAAQQTPVAQTTDAATTKRVCELVEQEDTGSKIGTRQQCREVRVKETGAP